MSEHIKYEVGALYEYVPTDKALKMGDKPGVFEVLGETLGGHQIRVLYGIENLVGRYGETFSLSNGCEFSKGARPLPEQPSAVDSGITFDDIIG